MPHGTVIRLLPVVAVWNIAQSIIFYGINKATVLYFKHILDNSHLTERSYSALSVVLKKIT